MKILHVIQSVSIGGASRAMIVLAKALLQYKQIQQSVISLLPAQALGINLAHKAGLVDIIESPTPEQSEEAVRQADLIQVHFWNNPDIYRFLTLDLPPSRILIWCHISGVQLPHIISKSLIDFADILVATSPYTVEKLHEIKELEKYFQKNQVQSIYSVTDWERIQGLKKISHHTFNVGYIGTTTPTKMHPNYIQICAGIQIPNLKFIVCGNEQGFSTLKKQADKLKIREKFDFRGYVEDIKSVLGILDVFGYPLCPNNYSTAELVLQEAMLAGIPPVIFPYGGAQKTVIHQETGLIVDSEQGYQRAIEFLYHHPEERERLGNNAQKYAQENFNPDKLAQKFVDLYQELCNYPKIEHQLYTQKKLSGAEIFIQSLGHQGEHFKQSLHSENLEELLLSDRKIATSSPVVCHPKAGGIYHYQEFYPDDSFLQFWAGLTRQNQGDNIKAISLFTRAIELGFSHWRIYWYLLQVAEKVNNQTLVNQCVNQLKQQEKLHSEIHRLIESYSKSSG
ncbi:MAG: glycosyltransferase family 4 protein [Okeania sp. SIO3B5]|uniref:glycosyltransferase family 4 protein n=1 Tax=Okeania sp. SIO3B5 TaxID=2607811 RepID=UPI0013FE8D97|nr:glycosyltransferase family 4 protein [Okeania sp. SIO3B5]NEO58066.1 glycosyltransferase family 4 protein [Okeania sp. SIO3B5]